MFNDYDVMMGLIGPGAVGLFIAVTIAFCVIVSLVSRKK